MIWFKHRELSEIKMQNEVKMLSYLGIRITELGDDFISGTLPVDNRTQQPFGLLHGGALVTLAESLGSIGANLVVDPDKFYCVGLDVNANHLHSVREGLITGLARPIHVGRTTQVWQIRMVDEAGKKVGISRLTLAVLEKSSL